MAKSVFLDSNKYKNMYVHFLYPNPSSVYIFNIYKIPFILKPLEDATGVVVNV